MTVVVSIRRFRLDKGKASRRDGREHCQKVFLRLGELFPILLMKNDTAPQRRIRNEQLLEDRGVIGVRTDAAVPLTLIVRLCLLYL